MYPNYPMPMFPQMPAQMPTGNGSQPNTLLRVNGIEGAKAFPAQPSQTMALFDSNEDLFYIKTTDAGGFATIKTYSFKEVDSVPTPTVDYVTRQEFEELKEAINGKFSVRKQSAKQPNVDDIPI